MGSVLKGTIETAGGGNAKGSSPQAYFLMKLVREPVIPEDVYSVEEVARLLHISPDRVRSFAARDNNPLPSAISRAERAARSCSGTSSSTG